MNNFCFRIDDSRRQLQTWYLVASVYEIELHSSRHAGVVQQTNADDEVFTTVQRGWTAGERKGRTASGRCRSTELAQRPDPRRERGRLGDGRDDAEPLLWHCGAAHRKQIDQESKIGIAWDLRVLMERLDDGSILEPRGDVHVGGGGFRNVSHWWRVQTSRTAANRFLLLPPF